MVAQGATTNVAAAHIGSLHLGHLDIARERLTFQTHRALIGAPDKNQQTERTHQEQRSRLQVITTKFGCRFFPDKLLG
jgi:hypothetical protein